MELKTKVSAEDGKQDLLITREFDLPVALLFKAYVEPEIIEQSQALPHNDSFRLTAACILPNPL